MASRLWKQKWFQRIQYFYSCLYFQWAVYNIIYKYIFHVRRWVDSSWPDIGRRFILSFYWFSHNLSLIGLVAHKTHLWDSCLDQVQMGWDTLQSNVIHARFAVLAAVVQSLSHIWLFATLWKQHTGLPCPSPAPRVCSNLRSLSLWCHPTISSSVTPFSFCPHSFPSSGSFPKSQLFVSGGQSIGASASASVLPMNIQGWFPLGWLVWSPCCPRDSQESSPAPQFKSISSSVFSLLYGPTLTCIHDYWKNHSFDSMDLCWQTDVSFYH